MKVYMKMFQNQYLLHVLLFKKIRMPSTYGLVCICSLHNLILTKQGNCKSTTSLHKDPYENIYAQIKGQKHFVLLPPLASVCVNEKILKAATYTLDESGKLQILLDEPYQMLPFPTWDPDKPNIHTTLFSRLAKPLRVTLNPGDMLYLPALWFHKVSQSSDPVENFCCAVNYW